MNKMALIYKRFLICTFGLIFSSIAHSKSETLTLEELSELSYVGYSKISPNGNHIAYTLIKPRNAYSDDDGVSYVELHVTNKDGKSRAFVTGEVKVSHVQWSSDSSFIYYLAKRNQDKHQSIYRIAIDGGESEKYIFTKSDISSFSINHNQTHLTYLAKPAKEKDHEKLTDKGFKALVYEESKEKMGAFVVELKSKDKVHIKLSIDSHLLSAVYSPTNNDLLIKTVPTPLVDDKYMKSQYRVYDQLGSLKHTIKTRGKLGVARWSKDGNRIAYIGAQNEHDPQAGKLFVNNIKTGETVEYVKNYQGHIVDIKWQSEYQLAFLGNKGTGVELSSVNLDSSNVKNIFESNQNIIKKIDLDKSGTNFALTVNSRSHPNEVFGLFSSDKDSQELKQLSTHRSILKNKYIPKQESITYYARDGLPLDGLLIYPKNYKKSKRYPLILMVHGGPEAHYQNGWLQSYSRPISYASEKGFVVFLPNYRGSTGRGVDFSKLGQGDYAGKEFDDLVDAITHLDKQGIINKDTVGITGGSYGGYASAWGATALSEHFAASVMFVGISDQLSKFGTTDIPNEMYNVHARSYPWEKWQWMLERSPIYHTDKAKTPLLIMHGDSDTRVHPSQSMELYRYIKTRTDTPVRLVLYPGEGHGNRKVAAKLDYSIRLMRWMEFYLKGRSKGNKIPNYKIDHAKKLSKTK